MVAPWTSNDGVHWRAGEKVDLTAWAPDFKAWDSMVAAAEKTEHGQLDGNDCMLSVDQFEEGPATLLMTGHLVCAKPCGSFNGGEATWTSPDGLTWTPVDRPATFGSGGVGRISGGPSGFIATGRGSPQALWLSADGRTWRNGTLPDEAVQTGGSAGDPVAFVGGYVLPGVVVTGSGTPAAEWVGCEANPRNHPEPVTYQGALWSSTDGVDWTRAGLSGLTSGEVVHMSVDRLDDHTLIAYESSSSSAADGNWTDHQAVVWMSHDAVSWKLAKGYRVENGLFRLIRGRDQSLVSDCPESPKDRVLYVVDGRDDLVALRQIGDPPAQVDPWASWGPMALGPAGLLVTDDGTHFWIGTLS